MRLEAVLKQLVDAGTPPKFIYTIPTHHNPTGSILPRERRERLLELARAYDTLVVDDHCYGDIVFQSDSVPPNLYDLDEHERVVYVASFSKILGPGVRQGYFMAPEGLQRRIMANKMDGGTNALASMVVAEFLGDHLWDHIRSVNEVMKARKQAVVESLAVHFGDLGDEVWWTDPPGGMFVWVRIPAATDTRKVLQLAASRGVFYTPGQAFSATGEDIPYLRIAYGFPTTEDIPRGHPHPCGMHPRSPRRGNSGVGTRKEDAGGVGPWSTGREGCPHIPRTLFRSSTLFSAHPARTGR